MKINIIIIITANGQELHLSTLCWILKKTCRTHTLSHYCGSLIILITVLLHIKNSSKLKWHLLPPPDESKQVDRMLRTAISAAEITEIPWEDCDDSEVFTVDASFTVTCLQKLRLDGTNNELYDTSYCKHNSLIYSNCINTTM